MTDYSYKDANTIVVTYNPINGTAHNITESTFWATDNACTPPIPTGGIQSYYSKVLKAVKDTESDSTDYALYINKNSAMLNDSDEPAETGDDVAKIHSISSNVILTATVAGTLTAEGYIQFDATTKYTWTGNLGTTAIVNGTEVELTTEDEIVLSGVDGGILESLIIE